MSYHKHIIKPKGDLQWLTKITGQLLITIIISALTIGFTQPHKAPLTRALPLSRPARRVRVAAKLRKISPVLAKSSPFEGPCAPLFFCVLWKITAMKNIEKYLYFYKSESEKIGEKTLTSLLKENLSEAKSNYRLLPIPRLLQEEFYIDYWIHEEIVKKVTNLSTTKILAKKSGNALSQFLALYPPQQLFELQRIIFNTQPYVERERILRNQSFSLENLEKKFTELLAYRNDNARENRFSDFISMSFKNHRVPENKHSLILDFPNNLVNFCNDNLPQKSDLTSHFYSEFNNPCFICTLKSFPKKSINDIFDLTLTKFPLIKLFINKINIVQGDFMRSHYVKENDSFEIEIDRNANERHKIFGLIHELSHVVAHLQDFEKNINPLKEGRYYAERASLEVEIELLKAFSLEVFKASLGEILFVTRRVQFELEIYKQPHQDTSKIYANTFNKCFRAASQIDNPTYLLDDRIVLSPLSSLPHAVAYNELIPSSL